MAAFVSAPPWSVLNDLPLLLASAAALESERECGVITFYRQCKQRGERSNAALVGTCKADNIQSRRRLRKANESQAERQRVVEVHQIV